jgi:hypothetical protein
MQAPGRAGAATRHGRDPWVLAWVGVLVAVVVAPLVRPGFALRGDMVFVPQQFLLPDAFGLGTAVPRAVPADAVLALLTTLVDGAVVQRLALAGALLLAGVGAARLVPGPRVAAAAAATLAVWNPYVAERLLLGHWTLLLAYGALPWLAAAALDLRAGRAAAGRRTIGWLAPAALVPGGGLLALLVLLPVVAWPGGVRPLRRLLVASAAWTAVNAPWWLPAVLHPGGGLSDPRAVEVFAARADTALGLLGSLVGLGGVWNADAVPASRGTPAAAVVTVLLLGLAAVGYPTVRRAWGGGADGLLVGSIVGVALAGWGAWAPSSLATVIELVPGAGLLRDGQRLVAPLAVLLAVAVPLGVLRVVTPWSALAARRAAWVGLMLLPLVVLPDLAVGLWGRLVPVGYPAEWTAVREVLRDAADEGDRSDVVSLPWQPFRRYPWNDDRTLLDPAPRFFDRTVVVSGDLPVTLEGEQLVVVGEDVRAQAVGRALGSGRAAVETLPALGIGWVLVQRDTPGAVPDGLLAGAALVHDGERLDLYRVASPEAGVVGPGWSSASPWVLAADAAVLALVLLAAASAWWSRERPATLTNGPPGDHPSVPPDHRPA